jgi:putative transposase
MFDRYISLVNGEIYHVISRGAADSLIFRDDNDYYRGIFSLYEFNTSNSVEIRRRREKRENFKAKLRGSQTSADIFVDDRDNLVEIMAFCFMPNHIHLLIRQLKDNGITNFMKKLGTGYANYFNKKHSRIGHLFQGRFKAVHINDDEQLKIVFAYIHSNCVSLMQPKWKEVGIKDLKETNNFIEIFKWSSYGDFVGNKNFPSVTSRNFLVELMGGISGCKEYMDNWLKTKGNIKEESNNLLLE